MGTCRLCNNDRPLVKAHIIPAAFYRPLRARAAIPLLISDMARPKNSLIGIYDREILCDPCESKFQRLDDYGSEVLLTRFGDFVPKVHQGTTTTLEMQGVDQLKLLRFLVSVLWRASVSGQPFFDRVQLGPYERLASIPILDPHAAVPLEFGAMLSIWTNFDADEEGKALAIQSPWLERWGVVAAYRFYFGRVVAHIKVSNHPFADGMRGMTLRANSSTLQALGRDLNRSSDMAAMRHVSLESERKFPRKPPRRR